MSNEEIEEILNDLVEMSEEHFQECIEYVGNIDESDKTKNFFEELLRIAYTKRCRLAV